MSVESMSWALKVPDLPPAQKLVLIGIANHDGDGGAWPSIATLAEYACVSERNVQKHIAALVDRGLVVRHDQQGGTARTPAGRRPNLYELRRGVGSDTPTPVAGDTPPLSLPTPEPSSNRPDEPSSSPAGTAEVLASFDRWWKLYPSRPNNRKAAAQKAWRAMWRRGDIDQLRKSWPAWSREIESREERFRPHSSTFLNERWYLEPPTPAAERVQEQRAPIAAPKVADKQWSDAEWAAAQADMQASVEHVVDGEG